MKKSLLSLRIVTIQALALVACAAGTLDDPNQDDAGGSGGGADCTSQICSGGGAACDDCESSVGSGGSCDLADCPCESGMTRTCYSGPTDTEGVGPCHGGVATCEAAGTWGPCEGELVPMGSECSPDTECSGSPCAGGTALAAIGGDNVSGMVFGALGDLLAVDASGNLFVTGNFRGTIDFGCGPVSAPGQSDAFLVKFSPALTCIWHKTFGATVGAEGTALGVRADGGVVLAGDFAGTIDLGGPEELTSSYGTPIWHAFAVEYNAAGDYAWSQEFGALSNEAATGAGLDQAGNAYLVLNNAGENDYDPTTTDGETLIVKLDANGEVLFEKTLGVQGGFFLRAMAVDADGEIALTGGFNGSVDFGAGPLKSTNGGSDIFIAKLNSSGTPLWSRAIGAPYTDQLGGRIAFGPDETVFLRGELGQGVELGGQLVSNGFVGKFDQEGNHLWSRSIGQYAWDGPMVVDAAGNTYLSGTFLESVDFGAGQIDDETPIYVAKLNESGDYSWSRAFGNSEFYASVWGMKRDDSGHVFVFGGYSGSIDPGTGPLPYVPDSDFDFFLAKFAD